MKLSLAAWVLAPALLIVGCNAKLFQAEPTSVAFAEEVYADLVRGEDIVSRLPEEFHTDQQRRMMTALREMVPTGKSAPADVVGWNFNTSTGVGTTNVVTLRYDYPKEDVTFTVTMRRKSDKEPWSLVGFNIAPATEQVMKAPRFGEPGSVPPEKPAKPEAASGDI